MKIIQTIFLLTTCFIGSFLSHKVFAGCFLINHVTGYTAVKNSENVAEFSWLLVKDKKVAAIGRGKAETPHGCEIIDGDGQYLLPGLIDAHGHVLGLGTEITRVQLRGVQSEQSGAQKVAQFAAKNPQNRWVLGRGWNQVLWVDKQFPTKSSLDATNVKRPIALRRIDGHAIWVNSEALKQAGIDSNTPDPSGGKIIKDSDGNPTGVLVDNAVGLIEKHIPPMNEMELAYAYDKAFQHLLSVGLVGAHDAGVDQASIDFYKQRLAAGRLPIRIYGMLNGASSNLDRWLKDGPYTEPTDTLSLSSVKLYVDGALGSRGAALLAPYSDDGDNKGLLVTEPKPLKNLMAKSLSAGFQVNVHAIGDRGNRIVLDNFESIFKSSKGRHLRNRIEHAQIVSPEDIPRFKSLGIVASMQPTHATSDMNMAGDRLGEKRLVGAYAWHKFLQQGTVIASGSDFPVELANPFHGLHAAITRQNHQNQPTDGWLPAERMTPSQALRSFTLDAAWAAHQEKTLGSLEKGKWADFILVDRDVIKGDPKQIWKTRVLQTWIAGKKVFQLNK